MGPALTWWRMVMGISDKVVVLEFGKKIADGRPADDQDIGVPGEIVLRHCISFRISC